VRAAIATALLLLALALAAAGCGGGGNKSTTAEAAESSSSSGTTTEGGESTTAAGTTTTPKSCKELTTLANRVSAAFSNTNPKNIEKNAKLLKHFADQTPQEIRPDFELIASDVEKIAASLHGVKNPNSPTPSERQRIQKAASSIDQAKLSAAIRHITSWSQKNCNG
jgi:hypothetical protein